jgi:ABC-type multidrug transport system ATPase subunit
MDEGSVTALLGANGAGKTTTACNLWDDVSQSPTASPINGFAETLVCSERAAR